MREGEGVTSKEKKMDVEKDAWRGRYPMNKKEQVASASSRTRILLSLAKT
jgi:hypothetical protein